MLTVVTGTPGHGKSDLVDQICLNLAQLNGWKTAYCSFEKPPKLHIAQLAEKLIGKPFFDGATLRMTQGERDWAIDWINDYFSFMDYRKGGPSDIEGILEMASASVMRMGSRILVIDPYNYIEVDRELLETDFISDMLTKVQQWAKVHDCHVFFIAHPKHVGGDREGSKFVPGGFHISKSAAWFAKADFGLSVWRDMTGALSPEAHVWKVKWSWMGSVGDCSLKFNNVTTRWTDVDEELENYDWSF
jgi:twinkle protein